MRRSQLLQEWIYVARYLYPHGRVPIIRLAYRRMLWQFSHQLRLLHRSAIVKLDAFPRIEILIPDLAQEYALYIYRTPLMEAEFWQLARIVTSGMTVLNIGANVGIYALGLAQYVAPHGRVYAFEPDPDTYRHLTINVVWNQLRRLVKTNIYCYEIAISNTTDLVRLYRYPNHLQHSLFPQTKEQSYVEVQATTLNKWIERLPRKQIDFLCMDVEGAEALVLQGASDLLSSSTAPVIMCEFNKKFGTPEIIWNLLHDYGYRFWHYNARQDSFVPVNHPLNTEIYTHRQHMPGYGYGNVICAKPPWKPGV
jgi:FkbM family methyltransferase